MIWLVLAALTWGLCVQPNSIDYGAKGFLWSLFSGLVSGAGVIVTVLCAIRGFTQIGILDHVIFCETVK